MSECSVRDVCYRYPGVPVSTVQLQGRDPVGPEPTHQVADPRDEGPERV